jgi:hypothetical protein
MGSEDEVSELRHRYLHDREFRGYGVTKKLIMEVHERFFGAAYDRYLELMNPKNGEINDILQKGGARARDCARKTIAGCRNLVGLS